MSRGLIHDVRLAFALLTAVPVGTAVPEPGKRAHAADHFVLVGGFFSCVGLVVAWLANTGLGVPQSELLGLSLVAAWAALSRGLHWDGLADVADAWTVVPERRHSVMKDSHVGAFGVLAIVVVFGVQSMSLAVVLSNGGLGALAVCAGVPIYGRLAASIAAWLGRPLRSDGLGASVIGRPGFGAVVSVLVVAIVSVVSVQSGFASSASLVVGLGSALVVPHVIANHIGGVNGDVMGASVVLTELLAAMAAAAAVTFR